jgi:hypothetical protein
MASKQVFRDELACDGKSSLTRTPSPPACSMPLRAAHADIPRILQSPS